MAKTKAKAEVEEGHPLDPKLIDAIVHEVSKAIAEDVCVHAKSFYEARKRDDGTAIYAVHAMVKDAGVDWYTQKVREHFLPRTAAIKAALAKVSSGPHVLVHHSIIDSYKAQIAELQESLKFALAHVQAPPPPPKEEP